MGNTFSGEKPVRAATTANTTGGQKTNYTRHARKTIQTKYSVDTMEVEVGRSHRFRPVWALAEVEVEASHDMAVKAEVPQIPALVYTDSGAAGEGGENYGGVNHDGAGVVDEASAWVVVAALYSSSGRT